MKMKQPKWERREEVGRGWQIILPTESGIGWIACHVCFGIGRIQWTRETYMPSRSNGCRIENDTEYTETFSQAMLAAAPGVPVPIEVLRIEKQQLKRKDTEHYK